MRKAKFLIAVSRPRFWFYIFGPFLVGAAAGAADRIEFVSAASAVFALYFLFPANLLVYGINDIFDYETDRLNRKKEDYEILVHPKDHRLLTASIIIANVPFFLAGILLAPAALPALAGFVFFAVFYSAPPIRAKTKPVLDSVFNVLYVFPGIFSFSLFTGDFPPADVLIASGMWTFAMHAYSAVPDIGADREAGVSTIATLLGSRATLIVCLALFIGSSMLAFKYLGLLSIVLGVVYGLMTAVSIYLNRKNKMFAAYRLFPLINTAAGFLLFWHIALAKFF